MSKDYKYGYGAEMAEKTILLHYLEKILHSPMPRYIEDEITQFMQDFGDRFLGRARIKKVCKPQQAGDGEKKTLNFYDSGYRLKMRDARKLAGLEKKNYDWDAAWRRANAKLDAIFDVFDLSAKLREPLRFLIHCDNYQSLGYMWGIFAGDHIPDASPKNYKCLAWISGIDAAAADDFLDENGPLYAKGILDKEAEMEEGGLRLTRKFRQILNCKQTGKEAIVRFILNKRIRAKLKPDDFQHIAGEYAHIRDLLKNAVLDGVKGVNILLYGEPGTGKSEMAATLARDIGVGLFGVGDGAAGYEKNDRISEMALTQYIISGRSDTLLVFDEAEDAFFDESLDGKTAGSKLFKNRLLENNAMPVVWTTNDISNMDPAFIRRFTYALELPKPDERAKINMWARISKKHGFSITPDRRAELAQKYDIAPSFIETAIKSAQLLARRDTAEHSRRDAALERTIESLQKATYGYVPMKHDYNLGQFNPMLLNTDENLEELAQKLDASKSELRHRFSVCLFGPAGTGKSAFARYLADKMGMPVLHKRASDLEDMYVGETEKNIARAFREAAEKKAMLVFDEADSFLRDRRGAQRSWEISGVNEMLTQMEHAQYPFICTTNMMDSLDPASLRRFTFKVKYDYLKHDQVAIAFRHFFGVQAPHFDRITGATPGDFVVVKNRADVMDITDADELLAMLRKEVAFKKAEIAGTIGYGR